MWVAQHMCRASPFIFSPKRWFGSAFLLAPADEAWQLFFAA